MTLLAPGSSGALTSPDEHAPALRPPSPRRSLLRSDWGVWALFALYPIWWALGLNAFVWTIIPALLGVSIVMSGQKIRAPRGFFLWLGFIVWMLLSATQIDTGGRMAVFLLRASWYVGLTIWMIYLTDKRRVPKTETIVKAVTILWMVSVVGGVLGLLWPFFQFSSPMARIVPGGLLAEDYVRTMVTPGFADVQEIGLGVSPRPKAPYFYTNGWGAAMALLTPFALSTLANRKVGLNRLLVQVMLAVSIIPIIFSLNRGLWLSLTFGIVYAAVRLGARGQVRALAAVVALMVFVVGLVFTTSLGDVASSRVDNAHSDEGRSSLYEETLAKSLDSPIIGFGGPRPQSSFSQGPSLGTHGHLWLVVISQGFVGVFLYFGFAGTLLWTTRSPRTSIGFWGHIVLFIGLTQIFFYGQMPVGIFLTFTGAMVALRESGGPVRSARERWAPSQVVTTEEEPVGGSIFSRSLQKQLSSRSQQPPTGPTPAQLRESAARATLVLDNVVPSLPSASNGNGATPSVASASSTNGATHTGSSTNGASAQPSPMSLPPLEPIDTTDNLVWISSILFAPEAGRQFLRGSTPLRPDQRQINSYLVAPNEHEPTLMLQDHRRAMAKAIHRFHDGMSSKQRLRNAVVPVGARVGALNRFYRGRSKLVANNGIPPNETNSLLVHLTQTLGEDQLLSAITMGPPDRANRKPVIQLLRPNGTVVAFVKVGWDRRTRDLIRNETDWLLNHDHTKIHEFEMPRLLHAGTWRGLELASTAPIPSAYRSGHTLLEPPSTKAFLEVAHLRGTYRRPLIASPFPPLKERQLTGNRAMPAIGRFIERYRDHSIEFGSWHGDFSPWNFSTTRKGFYIIDWEFGASDVPVGFDALHFHLQVQLITLGKPAEEALRIAREKGGALCREMGVAEEELDVVWGCYLIETITRAQFLVKDGKPQRQIDLADAAAAMLREL
jgi:hypothetical protein